MPNNTNNNHNNANVITLLYSVVAGVFFAHLITSLIVPWPTIYFTAGEIFEFGSWWWKLVIFVIPVLSGLCIAGIYVLFVEPIRWYKNNSCAFQKFLLISFCLVFASSPWMFTHVNGAIITGFVDCNIIGVNLTNNETLNECTFPLPFRDSTLMNERQIIQDTKKLKAQNNITNDIILYYSPRFNTTLNNHPELVDKSDDVKKQEFLRVIKDNAKGGVKNDLLMVGIYLFFFGLAIIIIRKLLLNSYLKIIGFSSLIIGLLIYFFPIYGFQLLMLYLLIKFIIFIVSNYFKERNSELT